MRLRRLRAVLLRIFARLLVSNGFAMYGRLGEPWLVCGAATRVLFGNRCGCNGGKQRGEGVAAGEEAPVFCTHLYVYNLSSGKPTQVGLPTYYDEDLPGPLPTLAGNWLARAVSEGMMGVDLDDDGVVGSEDRLWQLVDLRAFPVAPAVLQGDCSEGGQVDIPMAFARSIGCFSVGRPRVALPTSTVTETRLRTSPTRPSFLATCF